LVVKGERLVAFERTGQRPLVVVPIRFLLCNGSSFRLVPWFFRGKGESGHGPAYQSGARQHMHEDLLSHHRSTLRAGRGSATHHEHGLEWRRRERRRFPYSLPLPVRKGTLTLDSGSPVGSTVPRKEDQSAETGVERTE